MEGLSFCVTLVERLDACAVRPPRLLRFASAPLTWGSAPAPVLSRIERVARRATADVVRLNAPLALARFWQNEQAGRFHRLANQHSSRFRKGGRMLH